MKRIDPKTFCGPRAYFTDFDHRIIKRSGDLDKVKLKGERKLKSLLLLKGQIVCAASHLTSRFAYEFFKDNPILLTSGAIIPAFRSDKNDLAELFEKKRFKEKGAAIQFFKEHLQKTVNWDLDKNSSWFRDRFLNDIEDNQSIICTQLSQVNRPALRKLASEIRKGALLGRDLIDHSTSNFPRNEKRLIQNYRELLYHMSGARVVNCESALPQENFIDYDVADIRQKRIRLSEEQILSKFLIELVLDSLQKSMLPVELFDALSFNDVLKIRQPLMASEFQNKYDSLINKAVGSYTSKESELYSIEQLEAIRKDLAESFNKVLDQELPKFLSKKALEHSKELASVASSLALGVSGLVPGVGLLASTLSIMKDTPALIINIGQTYNSIKSISKQDKYYQIKEQLIKNQIENTEISNKATLYEMVELLMNVISLRIQL